MFKYYPDRTKTTTAWKLIAKMEISHTIGIRLIFTIWMILIHHHNGKLYFLKKKSRLHYIQFLYQKNMIKCFCPTFSKGCCFSLRPMQCVNRVVLTFVNFSIAVPTKQWWSLQWGQMLYEIAYQFEWFYKNMIIKPSRFQLLAFMVLNVNCTASSESNKLLTKISFIF